MAGFVMVGSKQKKTKNTKDFVLEPNSTKKNKTWGNCSKMQKFKIYCSERSKAVHTRKKEQKYNL